MTTYHEFDNAAIEESLKTMASHYDRESLVATGIDRALDDGHVQFAPAACISVTVENGKVCLKLPLGIGKVCLPIPNWIPNGTAAEACINICTTLGIPTGVEVTISVAGKVIVRKSFGKC